MFSLETEVGIIAVGYGIYLFYSSQSCNLYRVIAHRDVNV